jgi:DNA-binding HxlR family transcriptional regulator
LALWENHAKVTLREGKKMGDLREPLKELTVCGLPQALEVMGERWSFMILRASFNGLHHFEEFLNELGIARNILSNRLGKLVEHGILNREPCAEDKRRIEYRLTEKGFDLLPSMLSLRQWGQKYGVEIEENPVLVDEHDRLPIGPVSILAHDGRILGPEDLRLVEQENVGVRADGTHSVPSKALERKKSACIADPLMQAASA